MSRRAETDENDFTQSDDVSSCNSEGIDECLGIDDG